MAKLILNETIEVTVENFHEGKGRFSASGSTITDVIKPLISGLDLTSYKAQFDDGESYPIYGTYSKAYANTNGNEGNPHYEGFSISLENEEA